MEPSETIPGGAYQDASGNWRDAEGKPLSSEQVSAFKALQAKRRQTTPPDPDQEVVVVSKTAKPAEK